jgi:ABC-type multidrug transport system fused ATPase/permease subunit
VSNYDKYVFTPVIFIFSIHLHIRQGSLVALVGMVGSGKTSILSALLGEMNKVQGRVCVSGKIAYVPQTAWIINTTLKENILFGQDFDKNLYDRIIEACALKQDFGKFFSRERSYIKNVLLIVRYATCR